MLGNPETAELGNRGGGVRAEKCEGCHPAWRSDEKVFYLAMFLLTPRRLGRPTQHGPAGRTAVRHVVLTGGGFVFACPRPKNAVQRAVDNSAHMHPRREDLAVGGNM